MNVQPIEKATHSPLLQVHSIFYTIQGEGPFTGHPAVFVRLAGCNLQCPGCDTDYTSSRLEMTVENVQSDIRKLLGKPQDLCTPPASRPLVVITGGEPFRQPFGLTLLADSLIYSGYKVQIETNGTLPPPADLHPHCVIVCSPKAGKVNSSLISRVNAWKYVVKHDSLDMYDGLPILALDHSASPCVARPGNDAPIYLQPMDCKNEAENRRNLHACIGSCMEHGYILQLQVHKIINME